MRGVSPLHIGSDTLEVTILPLGASLVGVRFAGQSRNLVLGFADPADHARVSVYAGAIVGPVANRIRNGRVTLEGQTHQMPLNEAARTTLHSGPDGLHAQVWEVQDRGPDQVTLTCALPDGACGLPGNRSFTARYRVEDSTLTCTLDATTDQTTAINLAAHPYWNLDGSADVSGHMLHVCADTYLPTDAGNLPTGEQAPVTGTAFDFTTPRAVPLTPELDVNYCLRKRCAPSPLPAAYLRGSDGTTLCIETTAPGLQVYNGAYLPETAPVWQDGPKVTPFAAIALEPQHWPDAPHHADFPQITVMPKRHYRQISRYSLTRG